MSYGKEQQKEIETIRERSIILKLSDADVQRIWKKSGSLGLSVSELLENFVGDLIDGTYSNGSDERDLAQQWFDRCGFGMFPDKTFLSFLIEQESVEEFLKLYNNINDSKEQIAIMEENLKNGFMKMRDGSTYTWKDIVNRSSEGERPAYSSKEEWEKEQRENIESEKEDITYWQEEIDEFWNVFLQSANGKKGSLEEEIEKVLKWYEKMKHMIG